MSSNLWDRQCVDEEFVLFEWLHSTKGDVLNYVSACYETKGIVYFFFKSSLFYK